MNYYIDIRILPDPEFATPSIMSVLFGRFHNALVLLNSDDIGVSFPESTQGPTLGAKMRIHGSEQMLRRLEQTNWLDPIKSYIKANEISAIPADCRHRVVRRVQTKSNPERLRRRLMKRKGISEEEARKAIPDNAAKFSDLPYVRLKSGSTEQQFQLFIEQQEVRTESAPGTFSRYGLSQTATIPWF